MKKFLVILMVVAMASFLFVGCLGDGIIPDIDDEDDEDGPVLPTSVTPVIEKIINVEDVADPDAENIINLYSSDTQYMNADEVADGILVLGFAPKYSEINVYVGGLVVGTSTAYGGEEEFTVFVAEDNLGDDGAKTLYATATELGFAESAPSTVYAFTLDVVAPEMVKVAADLGGSVSLLGTVTVTFDEAVDEDIAEDEGNWTVKNISIPAELEVSSAELISPKVVELEVDYGTNYDFGDLILVTCSLIQDLAENETTDSYGYCHLELENYTITATAGDNGTILPSGAVTVNHGADQSFTITADTGYHIANVLVDGVSVGALDSYTFTDVTENHTIVVTFAINTYTLTMNETDGLGSGIVSPAVGDHTYNHGDIVNISATADGDSNFVTWSADADNPALATTTVTMDGNKLLTATFDLKV